MSSASAGKSQKQSNNVPDDWDDDVDDDEDDTKEEAKKIWEEANKKTSSKNMPIITSRAGGTSTATFIPPAQAFNKPPQILRRQSPSANSVLSKRSSTPNSGQSTPKEGDSRYTSMAEREKAYLDARDRIFRSSDSSSSDQAKATQGPLGKSPSGSEGSKSS